MTPRIRIRSIAAALAVAGSVIAAPVTGPALEGGGGDRAAGACASKTTRSISGTVFGQDGRDVNVSIGFDVVDKNGRALNTDPASPSYGCAKTGGYSMPQTYLNHFVSPQGQGQNTPMYDVNGKYQGHTKRAWKLSNLPSNATGVYIEVYHRGYTGSPCKDANGNWCFNKQTLTKYGNNNKHVVPIGTQNLPIRLPMTCGYKGTAGNIQGKIYNAAGQPVKVKNVFAWTETKWNQWPFYQGWGIAQFPRDGYYVIPSLASNQKYVIWLTDVNGRVHKRYHVPVSNCKATPLSFKI